MYNSRSRQRNVRFTRPLNRSTDSNNNKSSSRPIKGHNRHLVGVGSVRGGRHTDLQAVFTTPSAPGSFSGVQNLKRYAGESVRNVPNYLSGEDAYTLHKQRRIRFPRRRTYSKGIADLYQADLADLTNISHYNDGFKYLLTCIDVFSKKAWAIPLRTKSTREVADAFEKILRDGKCNMLQSDKGSEFIGSTFQNMLKKHGIKFYTSENEDIKAAVVERFNKTLKTKMYKYFTFKNTRRYIDILQDLIDSYNSTYHRSIGMPPDQVTAANESLVRARLYPVNKPKIFKWKYKPGDLVRIAKQKMAFAKGYIGNWSRELFKIKSRLSTVPVTYQITDLLDEAIKGKFYTQELQKVSSSGNEHFAVDKILKTRRRDGKVQYYVSWLGYPSKFNSWVNELESLG